VCGKLDGLSEYDVCRPATPTGTNLLALVKHMTMAEGWFFGKTFDRPFPDLLPWWDDDAEVGADLFATEHEPRTEIVDRCQRACAHADATQGPDLPRSALPLIAGAWTAVRRVVAREPDSARGTPRGARVVMDALRMVPAPRRVR
jgi:Protein of unknown function (DUF664)